MNPGVPKEVVTTTLTFKDCTETLTRNRSWVKIGHGRLGFDTVVDMFDGDETRLTTSFVLLYLIVFLFVLSI